MMRLLYNLLFPVAFIAILPRYLARMFKRGGFREDFGQRFAHYSPELRDRFNRGGWIWVHAVSVGELLIALKLLEELHRLHPAWKFVVSSTTSTAHALAVQRLLAQVGPNAVEFAVVGRPTERSVTLQQVRGGRD